MSSHRTRRRPDGKRRRKPYTRVADSLLWEPIAADDAAFATLIRLQLWLNSRWARGGLDANEAVSARITPADLAKITNRAALRHGRALLAHATHTLSTRLAHDGRDTLIFWPKFAVYQGYGGPIAGSESATAPAPSPEPSPAGLGSRPKPPKPPPGYALRIARLLADGITQNVDYAKTPSDLSAWGRDIDRLIRLDGAPKDRVEAIAIWAPTDPFWRKNILSGAKLRQHFPRLWIDYQASRIESRASSTERVLARAISRARPQP